jgi:hypothetical protein
VNVILNMLDLGVNVLHAQEKEKLSKVKHCQFVVAMVSASSQN